MDDGDGGVEVAAYFRTCSFKVKDSRTFSLVNYDFELYLKAPG
jgi:hypothetical protein